MLSRGASRTARALLFGSAAGVGFGLQQFTDTHVRMRADLTPTTWKAATTDVTERLCLPEINHDAQTGLKFIRPFPNGWPPPHSRPG